MVRPAEGLGRRGCGGEGVGAHCTPDPPRGCRERLQVPGSIKAQEEQEEETRAHARTDTRMHAHACTPLHEWSSITPAAKCQVCARGRRRKGQLHTHAGTQTHTCTQLPRVLKAKVGWHTKRGRDTQCALALPHQRCTHAHAHERARTHIRTRTPARACKHARG